MSGRKGELTEAEQLRIGAQILELRSAAEPVAWKAIEGMFDRDRSMLWRYAQAAATKMQQESPKMQHLGPCGDHEAAG